MWYSRSHIDDIAVEEPLEIRLGHDDESGVRKFTSISVTMRTPGDDAELSTGFLFTEGIVRRVSEIQTIQSCANSIKVILKPGVVVDLKKLQRNFYVSSSCGVCGKNSIEAIRTISPNWPIKNMTLDADSLCELPEKIRYAQHSFIATGGMHAAALFDVDYQLIVLREDVGRHNALDKVIGWALLQDCLPLGDVILWLSGRASFELIQKAYMAGIQVVVVMGAPSSLAIDLALEFHMTLVGFLREKTMNVYSGEVRC